MTKNKFLNFLIALGIAIALWAYVITVVSPGSQETIENIPIILRNNEDLENRGFIVVTEEVPTVNLTLSGNRTDLVKVDRSNISLIVDLSTVLEPGTHKLNFKESFPGSIADGAITIENRYPSQIELKVEVLDEKEIPINLVYSGRVKEGYWADTENAVLDNPTVRIKGPASVISTITQAVIPVELDERSKTITQTSIYTLCDKDGNPVDAKMVTTNVREVNLTMKIQQLMEIQLAFDITEGGGATLETSQIEFEPKTLKIAVSEAAISAVTDKLVDGKLILGAVNLGELTEDFEQEYPISLPGGVTNLSNLESVVLRIRFPELATKTFEINEFVCKNVPRGMEAEVVNKSLFVTVRGPAELIEAMTAENITVEVDFAQVQEGTFTEKAIVIMDAAFAAVGTIGNYTVNVDLHEAE